MRLTYARLGPEHAEALFPLFADPRVWRYIEGNDGATVDDLRARYLRWQENPDWINHAVLLDTTPIGRVQATLHGDWAEIAYVIGVPHWGHGYGREATAWLIDQLPVREVWAAIAPGNRASRRLLEALGFVEAEGRTLDSADPGDLLFRRG